jgi:cation diffusion facilitator CzcD-associated flavoprotein CzcO
MRVCVIGAGFAGLVRMVGERRDWVGADACVAW